MNQKRTRIIWLNVLLLMATIMVAATPSQAATTSPFTLTVTPSTVSMQPSSQGVFSISVACKNTCSISLGAGLSPIVSNGPILRLNRYHLTNGGGASISVTTGPATPLMTYTVSVTATDTITNTRQSSTATLLVNDFSITANPTTIKVSAGQTATSTVTVTSLNGFSGTIYYSFNEPSAATTGLACNLQPDPVTLSSTVTSINSTLSCSGTAGTYDVVISGSPYYGTPVRSATVTITVK